MNSCQGLRESFVVSGHAAKACGPGEASFDDPATGQQNKSALDLGVLDHLQLHTMSRRRMHLRSLAPPLGPVVSGTRTLLRRGLEGAAVEDHRGGMALAPSKLAQQRPQILRHGFETSRPNPALRLLVDDLPRRQIARPKTPLIARAHNVAQPLNTPRKSCLRCLASSWHNARLPATNAHSSSLTVESVL
jgi:hypothetical protein